MIGILVDTFISKKARGNPTQLFLLSDWPNDTVLHEHAINETYPVTAYVKTEQGPEGFGIRYFTSTGEIPACGHATLAAAGVVANRYKISRVNFITAGNIKIDCFAEEEKVFMQYPRFGTTAYHAADEIIAMLNLSSVLSVFFCDQLETLFIELNDPAELRAFVPDIQQLKTSIQDIKELVLTSPSDNTAFDFLLRSFCPWIGIDEDPVTGSVHSVLAPFWAAKTGKTDLLAWQASREGGEVFVRDLGNNVEIGGRIRIIQPD